MNYFEIRTMDLLIPLEYKQHYSFSDNAKLEFFQELINPIDLIVIPIGLLFLWFRYRRFVKMVK